MNILVVHEVDWAAKVVMEVQEIPELLARRGHRVVFVDYEESYSRHGFRDLARVSTRVRRDVYRVHPDGPVEVRTPGLIKLPGLDRLSSIPSQYREILRTIERERIDVVLLYSMPTSGLSAIRAARATGVPVVFRAIDVLHKLRSQPVSSGILLAEKLGMPRVDRVVALTERLADYAVQMGTPRDRVSVLRPGMAPEFRPEPRDASLMERWGVSAEDRVAMFLGTMYEFSGLDVVIQGFDEVVRSEPHAKLLLVGGANEFERFRSLATASSAAGRIVFTGMRPIQELPGLINLSHMAFNSFRRTSLTDTVFPEKLPRYMACGKPVLATPLSAARELLVGEENGVVFRDLCAEFTGEMKRLLGDEERCAVLGQAARSFVEKNYSWDRTIDTLESVFEEAIAEKRTRSARLSER